jgi:hypothetical protein
MGRRKRDIHSDKYEDATCEVCKCSFRRKINPKKPAQVCGKVKCCKLRRAFSVGGEKPVSFEHIEHTCSKTYADAHYHGSSDY